MPSAKDSFADPSTSVGLLLQVLASAANGNDVSTIVPELLSAVFNRASSSSQVRKLAYDCCRHAVLTEQEAHKLLEVVRGDLNSTDVEIVSAALRFLPCLPASELSNRLIIGELSEMLIPRLNSTSAIVRASALQALSSVLTHPDVQAAVAKSPGIANAYENLWDAVTDCLLDDKPFVVGLAAGAAAQLLTADLPGPGATAAAAAPGAVHAGSAPSASAFMMGRIADRAAQRLSAALGPVLEMCALVPAPAQTSVCNMLLALTRRVLLQTVRAAASPGGLSGVPAPQDVLLPSLANLVASVVGYLAPLLESGDVGAKTEACATLLAVAGDLAAAGAPAVGAAACVPQALLLEAVGGMLGQREREFVEAGLADMCDSVAGVLPALTPIARISVLRQLWPLVSRITDVSRRVAIFTTTWHALVAAEMEVRTAGVAPPPTLSSNNPFPAASGAAPAASAASATSADDPLGLLAALSVPPTGPSGVAASAGVLTAVPSTTSIVALLGDPYLEVLMTGKAPVGDPAGAFAAAQAAAAAAAASQPVGTALSRTLTSVASITRAAPPPPVRSDSGNPSTHVDPAIAGKAPAKPDKKAAGGMFGVRLFGKGKGDKKGADAAQAAEAAQAAAQEAARQEVARQEAEKARMAATAAARQAEAQGAPGSPNPSVGSSAALERPGPEAAASATGRPPLPHATLRHELLQSLLLQVAQHPAAAVAGELCAEHAAAARHDRHPPSNATSASQPLRLCSAVQWIAMISDLLSETAACASWEPYVLPAISSQPSVAAVGRAPVDFNSLTVDLWLGLMQAAVQASRAVQALLGRLVAEASDAADAAARQEGHSQSYGVMGYGVPYGMTPGAMAAMQAGAGAGGGGAVSSLESFYRGLLAHVDGKAGALQQLMNKMLMSWPTLSSATRPRAMWVAAHCLSLPGHWDERWEVLLSCLDHLLVRGTDVLAASRRSDVMGSALAGSLFKAGRQSWSDPTKPFLFDIAAASALCEAPEYEALGLVVGLAALQHLAGRLTNAIVEAVPHGAAGAAHGQAAAVAKRLEALLRHFISTELAGAPHVRDWVKRVMRSLSTIMSYSPPVNLPVTVAALGVIAKQAHGEDANGGADDDDSSDASSVYHPEGDGQHAALPPALAAAAAAMAAANTGAQQQQGQAQAQQAQVPLPAVESVGQRAADGVDADPTGLGVLGRPRAASNATSTSYLVHSAAAAVPMWGYPFASLSSTCLQNSRRARRHRTFQQLLAAGASRAGAPNSVLAAALAPPKGPGEAGSATEGLEHADGDGPPGLGPVLSSRTAYRLDQEALWEQLPSTHSPWRELTGPADPVLLRGCYVRQDPANPAVITVMFSAINQLPSELPGVTLSVKSSGPLLPLDRTAAGWELPRMAPHDRAATTIKFKLLGYGDISLQPRLQLCAGPPRTDTTPLQLNCLPLELPCTLLLRPPPAVPAAAEFFRSWNTLSARAELAGVCTWPGQEGAALLVSALLRQAPLRCCWVQHVAATAALQAGFVAATASSAEDSLALVLTTQLMPASAPGGQPESFITLSFRSNCPDLILSIQTAAGTWLQQLSSGTAALGGSGAAGLPSPAAKPPLHPRVAALLQAYAASAAQLAVGAGSGGLVPMASFGMPTETGAGANGGGGTAGATWLKNAALAEWQRLNSLSAAV